MKLVGSQMMDNLTYVFLVDFLFVWHFVNPSPITWRSVHHPWFPASLTMVFLMKLLVINKLVINMKTIIIINHWFPTMKVG